MSNLFENRIFRVDIKGQKDLLLASLYKTFCSEPNVVKVCANSFKTCLADIIEFHILIEFRDFMWGFEVQKVFEKMDPPVEMVYGPVPSLPSRNDYLYDYEMISLKKTEEESTSDITFDEF
jgi:hypothetical protein